MLKKNEMLPYEMDTCEKITVSYTTFHTILQISLIFHLFI